jgi:hypothetical protein
MLARDVLGARAGQDWIRRGLVARGSSYGEENIPDQHRDRLARLTARGMMRTLKTTRAWSARCPWDSVHRTPVISQLEGSLRSGWLRHGIAAAAVARDAPAAARGWEESGGTGLVQARGSEGLLRWTGKSIARLGAALTRQGHRVSARTVAALLVETPHDTNCHLAE